MRSWLVPFLHAVVLLTTVLGHDEDPTQQLLQSNKYWASYTTASNSTFFQALEVGQSPKILWIGCSDSRVPESVITDSLPGAMFVHRNIANQIPPQDDNSMSVLEYAVEHLKVEHVVVVGHTKCGGATASLAAVQSGSNETQTLKELPASNPVNKWLTPLTRLGFSLKDKLSSKAQDDAVRFLVEENVKEQVENISKSDVIKEAWEHEVEGKGHKVRLHGWIYNLGTGILEDLNVTRGPTELP